MKHWRVVTSTQLSHWDSIQRQVEQIWSEYKPSRWYVSLMTPQGATANRFENDQVRQPQADCLSVSISLIIPHMDRGSLLVSLPDWASQSQMWVRYVLTSSHRYCYRAVPGGKENLWPATALWASLSSAPVSLTWVILPNPVQHPRGFKMRTRQKVVTGPSNRKRHLSYLLYVAGLQGCLGLVGNGRLLLLFFIIFHQGHLQLTPSEML